MSRRYAESIRMGDPITVPGQLAPPDRFLWRRRLYVVRAVLDHWVEAGPWWRDVTTIDHQERAVWRVEAAAGRDQQVGTYDLCRDAEGHWVLVRAYD